MELKKLSEQRRLLKELGSMRSLRLLCNISTLGLGKLQHRQYIKRAILEGIWTKAGVKTINRQIKYSGKLSVVYVAKDLPL